ncbi:MAG: hypothetical protein J5U19_10970 [Candidatus Methanoperedens sp.]|nr:hypothetical protein [Candidatus Methanoperedens sp.]
MTTTEIEASEDEIPTTWTDLSDILREVSTYIRDSNPPWFKEHDDLFKKQTDGLFWIEYTEEEFAKRLYDSIGLPFDRFGGYEYRGSY